VRDIFLEDHTVDVLTLVLVRVLKSDDLDEAIEIDRVVEKPAAWANSLHCILCRLNHQATPLAAVDREVFNNLVDHLLYVHNQLLVNPCLHRISESLVLRDGGILLSTLAINSPVEDS